MQGNGGTVSAADSVETAVSTVMSGPASGVMAAAHIARAVGLRNAITYDMGGTSTDVGVIVDGTPRVHAELELEYGMPIHVPMVDVHAVGAGGGSIASVDEGGLLRVGPESAGARPGPICYGRGGVEPAITDANLMLGVVSPWTGSSPLIRHRPKPRSPNKSGNGSVTRLSWTSPKRRRPSSGCQ